MMLSPEETSLFFAKLLIALLREKKVSDVQIISMLAMEVNMPKARVSLLIDKLQEGVRNPPPGVHICPDRFDHVVSMAASILLTAMNLGGCACEIHHILAEESEPPIIAEKVATELVRATEAVGLDLGVLIQHEAEKMGIPECEVAAIYKKYPEPPAPIVVIRDMILLSMKQQARVSYIHDSDGQVH